MKLIKSFFIYKFADLKDIVEESTKSKKKENMSEDDYSD